MKKLSAPLRLPLFQGAGGTNAVTGVAGAWIDSTPLLIISGQAKSEDMISGRGVRQMGVQEVDIISLVSPMTKYAATVLDPQTIKFHLQKALHEAASPRRGPVWIEIPLDVQAAIIDENNLSEFTPPPPPGIDHKSTIHAARRFFDIIKDSRHPVVLIGNGVRADNAMNLALRFIERLGAPVLTTWKMSDFLPEDHWLYCGRPGIIGQRGANFTQQNADCLLSLGARLDLPQTGFDHKGFAPKAKKIIVDIDEKELLKLDMNHIELSLHCRTASFMAACMEVMDDQRPTFDSWLSTCRMWKEKYPVILSEYRKGTGLVNTYCLLDVLSDLLISSDLIVPASSGAAAELTQQAFRVKKGQRIINTPGLGAMGFDLPAAIGVCIASGGRRTIAIAGDGGIQMNIQELQTLKSLCLPIKIFVLNNGGYGSIKAMQDNRFNGNHVACDAKSGLTLPDMVKVATAYGLKSVKIENQRNLKGEVAAVMDMDGPVICDVIVDPDIPTAPRLSSEVLPDGRIVSKPMEDLWPFLDREEFKKNMEN